MPSQTTPHLDYSERSSGATSSERYLFRLCERTFLRLWSYSGLYRDQGKKSEKADGKELCDVLVLFENNVVIFSDKHCEFPDTGNVQTDWNRWFRRAILNSSGQLFGAERWITSYPNRVFVDRSCSKPFPLSFPVSGQIKFHKVAVARGVRDRCKAFFEDDSGSLLIRNTLRTPADHQVQPYQVGHPDITRGFVHVFDETGLEILLKTLDTASDFLHYLGKREQFLRGDISVSAAGEEELLAVYLTHMSPADEHDFVIPVNVNHVAFDKGHWRAFMHSPGRLAQLTANFRSYAWDLLIEKFIANILKGTQRTASSRNIAHQERTMFFLAREGRTRRRILAESLLGIVSLTPKGCWSSRVVEPSYAGDPFFIFLAVPRSGPSDDRYRDFRQQLLESYCMVLRLKRSDAIDIVGIATESGSDSFRSEDCVYLDGREWNEEYAKDALELQQRLDILTHEVRFDMGKQFEYPRAGQLPNELRGPRNISRNKKCPCKSGKRYRHCCGRAT